MAHHGLLVCKRLPEWRLRKGITLINCAVLIPMALSFIAWIIPGDDYWLRGFDYRSPVTLKSIGLLGLWIASVLLVVRAGFETGKLLFGRVSGTDAVQDCEHSYKTGLLVLEIMACVGLLYAYAPAGGVGEILTAIQSGGMNAISKNMRGGAGFGTLRYASIVAAALSFFLLRKKKIGVLRFTFDVFLLLCQALLSSRMSLLISLMLVFTHYYLESPPVMKLLPLKNRSASKVLIMVMSIVALFFLAAFLNYSRNRNYYQAHGVADPVMMSVYQILSYFAAPTQVALGVADAWVFPTLFEPGSDLLALVIPTFFRKSATGGMSVAIDYGAQIDINSGLTANSVFANVLNAYGGAGLLVALSMFFVYGIVFYACVRRRTLAGDIAAGAIAYIFLAVWRTYLAPQGIIIFILLCAIVLAVFRRMGKAWRSANVSRNSRSVYAPSADKRQKMKLVV